MPYINSNAPLLTTSMLDRPVLDLKKNLLISHNFDETRTLIRDISWAPLGLFSIVELIIYGLLRSCCVSCVLLQPHVSKQ